MAMANFVETILTNIEWEVERDEWLSRANHLPRMVHGVRPAYGALDELSNSLILDAYYLAHAYGLREWTVERKEDVWWAIIRPMVEGFHRPPFPGVKSQLTALAKQLDAPLAYA